MKTKKKFKLKNFFMDLLVKLGIIDSWCEF